MQVHDFRAGVLALSLLGIATCANAQWTITDLGDLPGGSAFSYANDINNAGQVVGLAYDLTSGSRAFLWQNGTMTDLGDLPGGSDYSEAYSINNAGQVVGVSSAASAPRAFLWQNGTMTDLGDLPGGGDDSLANDINDAGQVVGISGATSGPRAFLWQNGTMSELPERNDFSLFFSPTDGPTRGSGYGAGPSYAASDINNAGQVVGSLSFPYSSYAVLWRDGTPTFLGDLPGGIVSSTANGINNAGQVVGYSSAATGDHAFLWQNGTMTDLGDLPGGSNNSAAYGINNAGQVVGDSGAATGTRAFLWQNGVMTDLNTFAGVAGTGWVLTQATAINDLGQIVGRGINPQGEQRAFLLTPVPEPEHWAMLLAGFGITGWAARRRQQASSSHRLAA